MAYQNNNHRRTPEAIKDITLHPQAAPVDKLIKYQPDLTESNKSKANAEALVKIGQGIMDWDIYLQKAAQENALIAYESTEAVNNKKEWNRVSQNIQGIAKYNPYIKDSYKHLVAQDIYRSSVLKMNSNPNLHKLSENEFNQFVNDTKQEMFTAFREADIQPRQYYDIVEKFSKDCYNISQTYTEKNSEYNYQNSLIKQGSDLAFNLGVNTYNAKTDTEKYEAITNTINSKITECLDNGIPKDDIAKSVLGSALQSYIVENSDTLNTPVFKRAIKDLKIGETPISEILPNYQYEIHKVIKAAKRANYDDLKADYDFEQLNLKINTDKATKDFFAWYKTNQNATPEVIQQQALNLINQYGIDENGITFLHSVATSKNIMSQLHQVESNSETLSELGCKAALGTLKGEDVYEALLNKQINWKEGLQFIDRLDREAKSEAKEIKTAFTDLNKKLAKDGIYGKTLIRSQELKDLQNDLNQVAIDIDNGKISPEEAKTRINEIEAIANSVSKLKQSRNKNAAMLLNANYIRTQNLPSYTFETASKAFKKLGYIRGGYGQRIDGNITSGINPNRTINGETKPHRGYDVGAKEGTSIRNCNMNGKVVLAGYLNDMGNYVVIQYENGTFARLMHLQKSTKHLQGRTILANQPISYVGNTGKSTGSHLHADFWNRNLELINVETFAKGIK